ncbi:MAG: MlaD family protein [Flavobacteriaceae bacterium]|nr:MlaD family protein [Flavobacteriaceae bacterium]
MIKLSRELKTGLIAIITIILFIWGFSFIKNDNIFKKERVFYATYKNVQGLVSSSLVTINGYKVGKIDKISFHPQKKGYLIVTFSLNNDFQFSKKSIAKIYSSDLIGTKSLSIIPDYEGELSISGDTLKSEIEPGVFELLNEKVAPLQSKFQSLLTNTDSLMQNLNNILDVKTEDNIKASIKSLKNILLVFEKTSKSIDSIVIGNQSNLDAILLNSKEITQNLKQLTDSLKEANIATAITDFRKTIANLDQILTDINSGKGSAGKLLNDNQLYQNFTNASKELEALLRDMKLHPKRFVHFSLFGKKSKTYTANDSIK